MYNLQRVLSVFNSNDMLYVIKNLKCSHKSTPELSIITLNIIGYLRDTHRNNYSDLENNTYMLVIW